MNTTEILQGRCYCGAVTLTAASGAKGVINCHCGQCRALGGSAYTTWVSVGRDDTTVAGAEHLQAFEPTANGRRHFCRHCGAHVFTEDRRMPGILGAPAGLFGTTLRAGPSAHYFVDDRAAWHAIDDALPRFGGPTGFEPLDQSGARPCREQRLARLDQLEAKLRR